MKDIKRVKRYHNYNLNQKKSDKITRRKSFKLDGTFNTFAMNAFSKISPIIILVFYTSKVLCVVLNIYTRKVLCKELLKAFAVFTFNNKKLEQFNKFI